MCSASKSQASDNYNHSKKLFKKYLHNQVFTSADDYMEILKDYKKFSQDFRKRVIDAGLLDGSVSPKKTEASFNSNKEEETQKESELRAKTARNLVSVLKPIN